MLSGLFGLWATAAAAQDEDPDTVTIALDGGQLNEIVRAGALISGSVVAGVLVRETGGAGVSLRGYIPEDWKGQPVCAQVRSIDGLYEAIGQYTVPAGWTGGIAPLDFPTKNAALLESAAEDALAVRVTQGHCGEAENARTSVALWNASGMSRADLLLNSFRADNVFVYVGARETPVRCLPIEHPGRTAFDSKCPLDLAGLSGAVELEIYRIVEGKPAPPDTLTVQLPGG